MRRYLVVGLVGIVMGAALGGAVLVAVVPGWVPASLTSQQALTVVQPSELHFTDPHDVTVALTLDTSSGLRSMRGGVVTSLNCTAGQLITSGRSVFSVDGSPVVALATSSPLWRSIAVGDNGPDVAALESELARLGSAPETDAEWGWADARVFDALLDPVTTDDEGSVPLSSIAWLPAPEVRVASCPVALGASTTEADLIALFAPRISLARYVPLDGAVEGERELVLDGTVIPASADGVIVDRVALDSLAASPAFAQLDTAQDPPTITVSAQLTTAVLVSVLPPSSVYGLSGRSGCVQGSAGATPVTVIASQLGRTLVEAEGALDSVIVHPDPGVPCQ